MLGHKSNFIEFKKTEIIQIHNEIKLEINSTKKTEKVHKYVKIKQCTLNYKWEKKSHKGG